MTVRFVSILVGLGAVAVAACNRPAAPAEVAHAPAPARAGEVGPSCRIESAREISLTNGAELRVWTVKAFGLKHLAGHLLIATDGKLQTTSDVGYKWDRWDPTVPAATGELVLLIQDGKAFGVNGKRLPRLALDFRGSPPHTRQAVVKDQLLEGEMHPKVTSALGETSLGERTVIYAQVFTPTATETGSYVLGTDRESLVAVSKNGRTVVAVELEWAGP